MLVVLGPSVLEDGALLRRRRLGLMHCFWCEQQDAVSGDDLERVALEVDVEIEALAVIGLEEAGVSEVETFEVMTT